MHESGAERSVPRCRGKGSLCCRATSPWPGNAAARTGATHATADRILDLNERILEGEHAEQKKQRSTNNRPPP